MLKDKDLKVNLLFVHFVGQLLIFDMNIIYNIIKSYEIYNKSYVKYF